MINQRNLATMWCTAVVILCLALSGVSANWDGIADKSMSNLGFYTKFLDCDSTNDRCVTCFQVKAHGRVFMHVFEFTMNPVKFQLNMFAGTTDRKFHIIRDDPKEIFNMCYEVDHTDSKQGGRKVTVCIDNNFSGSGVTVPPECSNPIAVVSLDFHRSDDKIRGQQVLYCLPNETTPTPTQQMT